MIGFLYRVFGVVQFMFAYEYIVAGGTGEAAVWALKGFAGSCMCTVAVMSWSLPHAHAWLVDGAWWARTKRHTLRQTLRNIVRKDRDTDGQTDVAQ